MSKDELAVALDPYYHRTVARKKPFDKKFGEEFISSLPTGAGVYLVYSGAEELIYIGKAKNLRRRLSQYRNAKRCRKHHKMRAIVADAERIEYRICDNDLDACLLETRLIQENRPPMNVAAAFSFLYPMIGMRVENGMANFCYTNRPADFPGYEFHGAFRSRFITGEAFFSLMKLLQYVGHRVPKRAKVPDTYSYVFTFRQLPESWLLPFSRFWAGESREALELLVLQLLENAGARKSSSNIQEHLDNLIRFWRHEAKKLATARRESGFASYPVAQEERDAVFLKYRFAREEKVKNREPRRSVNAI